MSLFPKRMLREIDVYFYSAIKGYSRLGAAYSFLTNPEEAEKAYKKGLELDPNNAQLKKDLAALKQTFSGPGQSVPLDNPFCAPDLIPRLASNPATAAYLQDKDFLQILNELRTDSKAIGKHLQDPRVMATLQVLLGISVEKHEQESKPHQPKEEENKKSKKQEPKKPEEDNTSKEKKDV